jgi:hypothetical protein
MGLCHFRHTVHVILICSVIEKECVIANLSFYYFNLIYVHALSSCNHRHSLREVLDAPNVMNMIKDTKAAQEVQYRPTWLIYATCFLFISNTMKVKRRLPLSVIFSFRKRKNELTLAVHPAYHILNKKN